MRWNYRLVSAVLVLCSIIGLTFALYLEHVQGLEPCPLCVFQRVGLIGLGIFSLVAFVHNPKGNGIGRSYAFLGTLSILWSAGVAARHIWLQNLPPEKVPSCGPGLDYLVDVAQVQGALGAKLTGGGRGGCMIALAANQHQAEKIAQALERAGACQTWIQYLGE